MDWMFLPFTHWVLLTGTVTEQDGGQVQNIYVRMYFCIVH